MFPCAAYRQGHKWKRLHPEYIFSQYLTRRLLITLAKIAATVTGWEKPYFSPFLDSQMCHRATLYNETERAHKYMNGAMVTSQNKKTQFITQKNTLQIRQVALRWSAHFWTWFPNDDAWEFTLLPANENDTSISSRDVRLMPQDNFPPSTDGWYNDSAFIVQSSRFQLHALLQWIHLSPLRQFESLYHFRCINIKDLLNLLTRYIKLTHAVCHCLYK